MAEEFAEHMTPRTLRVAEFCSAILAFLIPAEGEQDEYGSWWWEGTCDSSCCALIDGGVLDRFADLGPRLVMWGGFHGNAFVGDSAEWSGHCWLELDDGTIVDPTSEQFGLEACAVLPAGDERYRQRRPGRYAWSVGSGWADDVLA